MRALLFAGALLFAVLVAITSTESSAIAADLQSASVVGVPELDPQGENAAAVEDDVVDVQVWTLVAAAGAAAVTLLLLLLRVAMGWVKPPPAQDDGSH